MEAMDEGGYPAIGETPQQDWQPPETAPLDGTRVRLLVESEAVYDEHIPALLMGGWRRVGGRDRVIGWKPL